MKKQTKTKTKKQPKVAPPVQALIITESVKRVPRTACLKQLEAHTKELREIDLEIGRLGELRRAVAQSRAYWRDIVTQQHYQDVDRSCGEFPSLGESPSIH